MKRIVTILILLSLVLLVLSCTTETVKEISQPVTENLESGSNALVITEDSYQIVIENSKFMPIDIEVKAGTTIEWLNKDSVDHTVTFENGDFDVNMPIGATATYTFTETGTFRYFCQYHPGMRGSVIVS